MFEVQDGQLTPSAMENHSMSNAVHFVAALVSFASRSLQSVALREVFKVALPKGA